MMRRANTAAGSTPITVDLGGGWTLANLTPHAVVLRLPDGSDLTVPASGRIARVTAPPAYAEAHDALPVPVVRLATGRIEGLPAHASRGGSGKCLYIVSRVVLDAIRAEADAEIPACRNDPGYRRDDVFAPATGPEDGAIRDDQGRIVAVTRLVRA